MFSWLDIIQVNAIALLLVFIGLLSGRHWQRSAARYIIGFCLAIICFLLFQMTRERNPSYFFSLLLFIGFHSTAFFFWMGSVSLVDENFRVTRKHWFIFLLYEVSSILWVMRFNPIYSLFTDPAEVAQIRMLLPAVTSFIVVTVTVLDIYRGLNDDLVEARIRFRLMHMIATGGVFIAFIIARVILHGEVLDQVYRLLTSGVTLMIIYFLAFSTLQFREDVLPASMSRSRPSQPVDIDLRLKSALLRVFEVDKFYREEGLTIRRLAGRLNEPEYKLRRLINGGLDFKNFNDFLNRYRVQEACEILQDPDDQRPVVRIAMELGYRSLASFNKAFKDLTGTTPSGFRNKSRA